MINKIKKALMVAGATAVIGLEAILGANARASNAADLTADYRQVPVQFYKVCFDTNESKWGVASIPFDKNSAYVFGSFNKDNSEKYFEGNIATKRGPVDLGLRISNNFTEESNNNIGVNADIDVSNKHGGIAALVNFREIEESKAGIRVNVDELSGYFMSKLNELEPVFGISYNGKLTLDISYDPNSDEHIVRASKGINTGFGTLISEIRGKYNDDGNFYGAGLSFIPKKK